MSKYPRSRMWLAVTIIIGFLLTMFFSNVSMPIVLRVVIASIASQVIIKKIVSGTSLPIGVSFPSAYFFGFLIALSYFLMAGDHLQFTALAVIIGMGIFNGFASWCNWEATRISQSMRSVFMFGDDVIAMGLCFMILREDQFMSLWVWIGSSISLTAIFMLARRSYLSAKKNLAVKGKKEITNLPVTFFVYVLAVSLIWGIVKFAERYLALEGVSVGTFLLGWYGGALLPAIIIFKFHPSRINVEYSWLEAGKYGLVFALTAATAIGLQFWTYMVTPLVIVQPIFMVSDMVFSALIGLIFFKEARSYSRTEWFYFGLGLVGSLFIILSFYK